MPRVAASWPSYRSHGSSRPSLGDYRAGRSPGPGELNLAWPEAAKPATGGFFQRPGSFNAAGKHQAIRWIDGQIEILASEFENSSAAAINDVGQIIGVGWRYGGDTGQFLLWSEANQCEQLHLPDGARIINRDGLIAGSTRGAAPQAFVWHDGELVYLPILAPYEGATVTDINDRGDVAGSLDMLVFGEENETGMPEAIPCVWIRTP